MVIMAISIIIGRCWAWMGMGVAIVIVARSEVVVAINIDARCCCDDLLLVGWHREDSMHAYIWDVECTPYGMGGDMDDTTPSNDCNNASGAYMSSDDEGAELLELPAPHTDNTNKAYAKVHRVALLVALWATGMRCPR